MEQQPFSGDSSLLKSINKSTLLQMVRSESPISRADLAKRTKLTRATVSALVEELMDEHLVVEIGSGPSSGGRKPVMLAINRHAGYVFGLELRATEILFIVTDLQGEQQHKTSFTYEDSSSQERTMRQVLAIVAKERERLPKSPLGLLGVGIGVHGFVEYPTSRILFIPYFGWKDADWKRALEAQLRVPVYIDNEANLAALGELEAGTAQGCSNVLYLSIGAGIGAGMILQDEIFRGRNGLAGEVGHTTIQLRGLICTCGNRGCWEMYASERSLAERLGLAYEPGITDTVVGLLEKSNEIALSALSEWCGYLAVGIGNMMHTFNPETVVVGNPIGKYRRWIGPHIEQALHARFAFDANHNIDIRYSVLDDEACALGAVSMVIRNIMKM